MGPELRRPAGLCDARLLRLRPVRLSGRLARRQMEPRGHDGRVLRRHRPVVDRHRLCADAAAGRHRPVRHRRVRRDLSSGRARDGDAEVEEHRHADRGERRVGQSRRRQRRPDHRLSDRQWRLAAGLRRAGRRVDRDRHRLYRRALAGLRGGEIRAEAYRAGRHRVLFARLPRAAAAGVGDRVHHGGDLQHHLPGHHLRAAEDLRRAPAGHRQDDGRLGRAASDLAAAPTSPP